MTVVAIAEIVRFVIMGIVDDVTTCECCGRSNLKRTVMLGETDADGNVENVTYYGTGCAAVALGRPRQHGAKVADEAAAANRDWQERATRAREWLAAYGPVEHAGAREMAEVFYGRNPHLRGRGFSARAQVASMLASARATLAERGLAA